jgi:hypothetical protein
VVFIIIGFVIAAALVVALVARNRESSSPLKTVESFKVGLEKISPQEQHERSPKRSHDAPAGLSHGDERDVSKATSTHDERA